MSDTSATDIDIMYRLLGDDVDHAIKAVESQDCQHRRRALIRTIFAAVEGTIYQLKQRILGRDDVHAFSAAELSLLREESYTLDSNGEPITQAKFLPVDQNFRFTMGLYTRGRDPSFKLDLGGVGWAAFKQAIRIRHRITHPKSPDSLHISEGDFRTVRAAYLWFYDTLSQSVVNAIRHLEGEYGSPDSSG